MVKTGIIISSIAFHSGKKHERYHSVKENVSRGRVVGFEIPQFYFTISF